MKGKYTSDAAVKYRDQLGQKAQADLAQFGRNRVWVEGLHASPESAQSQKDASSSANTEDDFFDSWDKPKAQPTPAQSRPAATPASVSLNSSLRSSTTTTSSAPTGPRTVSSASLRGSGTTSTSGASSRSKLGAQRTTGTGASAGGRSKLGAKKAASGINFEEAERKAKEEEERIKKLGYDAQREAEEAEAASAASDAKASAAAESARAPPRTSTSSDTRISPNGKGHARRDSDTQRLGMGMTRLGFGQVSGMSGAESAKSAETARKAAERKAKGLDQGMSYSLVFRDPINFYPLTQRISMILLMRATNLLTRKASPPTCTSAEMIMTQAQQPKHSLA